MPKKYKNSEICFGVPPEKITISDATTLFSDNKDYFVVHKAAKKDQCSFRITKDLLDSLSNMSHKINKKARLIITFPNYTLTCEIQNEN